MRIIFEVKNREGKSTVSTKIEKENKYRAFFISKTFENKWRNRETIWLLTWWVIYMDPVFTLAPVVCIQKLAIV